VAIVTGASSGIGEAIALAFAAESAAVAVDYMRHPEVAQVVVGKVEEVGGWPCRPTSQAPTT